MATTTNYSWSTPDDTALVKDGAAAIRSLGTAIDSTVFTNAGAAIAKSIVDAKGDIIAATADDTVARLAVGANNTVLTADSTEATGLKWATFSTIPANDSDTVATSQTTTSTSFTDLATSGPSVTVTTGTKALIIVSSQLRQSSAGNIALMSYAVSGASTVSANDNNSLTQESVSSNSVIRASSASVVTLTAGSNTFTAKYRVNAGTGTFVNRSIIVINLV